MIAAPSAKHEHVSREGTLLQPQSRSASSLAMRSCPQALQQHPHQDGIGVALDPHPRSPALAATGSPASASQVVPPSKGGASQTPDSHSHPGPALLAPPMHLAPASSSFVCTCALSPVKPRRMSVTRLFAKRLERGRFVWPQARSGTVSLTRAQLSMLLKGIDWRRPERTWEPQLSV